MTRPFRNLALAALVAVLPLTLAACASNQWSCPALKQR